MSATRVESLTNPRDSLPNVYTNVSAREIDFVTRFNQNWDALRAILGRTPHGVRGLKYAHECVGLAYCGVAPRTGCVD